MTHGERGLHERPNISLEYGHGIRVARYVARRITAGFHPVLATLVLAITACVPEAPFFTSLLTLSLLFIISRPAWGVPELMPGRYYTAGFTGELPKAMLVALGKLAVAAGVVFAYGGLEALQVAGIVWLLRVFDVKSHLTTLEIIKGR